MMTALLEYLNLPAVFLWAYYVELIRSIKVFPSLQCKLQFSSNHFPNFHLYFLNFALCFLASYFSKKIAGKIDAVPYKLVVISGTGIVVKTTAYQ